MASPIVTKDAIPLGGGDLPPIENEIPTYRAISPLAVASFLAGLLALLCYVNSWFLVAAALAVVLGVLGLRAIRQQPDAFTGRALAQLGIVLALVSGLSSITMAVTQDFITRRGAAEFTRTQLMPTLADRDMDGALWWRQRPETRAGLDPAQVRERMVNPNDRGNAVMFEMMAGAISKIMNDLKAHPNATLAFDRIDTVGVDGLSPFAIAVIRVDWGNDEDPKAVAADHDHQKLGQLIGVVLKQQRQGKKENWWVEEYVYPYKSSTYTMKSAPIDDGHGHAH